MHFDADMIKYVKIKKGEKSMISYEGIEKAFLEKYNTKEKAFYYRGLSEWRNEKGWFCLLRGYRRDE